VLTGFVATLGCEPMRSGARIERGAKKLQRNKFDGETSKTTSFYASFSAGWRQSNDTGVGTNKDRAYGTAPQPGSKIDTNPSADAGATALEEPWPRNAPQGESATPTLQQGETAMPMMLGEL
jgi:hypothetical protein